MNRVLTCFCACAVLCMPLALVAQEDGAAEGSTAGTAAEDIDKSLARIASTKSAVKRFHALVKLAYSCENVFVKLPRQSEFKLAVEGNYYPNGSVFRISDAAEPAVFEFGPETLVKVDGDAEFGTREIAIGEKTRVVTMMKGLISVSIPRTMPTGHFTVAYPNFVAKDLAGESNHELIHTGDGDEAVVHVITGMLALEGAHFRVARMSAADRVRVRTTGEALFTSLRGEAGDYKVTLDKGIAAYRDPLSGEMKEQVRSLEYSLTPQCAIKIFRKRSQVGGRMVVSVMTFDASGEIRNRYTFAEGTSKVNFGEEIVRARSVSLKSKSEETGKSEKKAGSPAESEAPAEGDALNSETSSSSSSSDDSGNAAGNDSGFGAL